jgi:hypothetical protein
MAGEHGRPDRAAQTGGRVMPDLSIDTRERPFLPGATARPVSLLFHRKGEAVLLRVITATDVINVEIGATDAGRIAEWCGHPEAVQRAASMARRLLEFRSAPPAPPASPMSSRSEDAEMDARYGFMRKAVWKPDEDEWLRLFLRDGESLEDPGVLDRIIEELTD